jgi:YesN/AraC family two-component response regulator
MKQSAGTVVSDDSDLATPVLVVDDDVEALESTAILLRTCHCLTPTTATNVMDALRLSRQVPFGAVLSDLVLPDSSGLELLRKLRAEGNLTPFVIVTGFGSLGSAIDALRLGVADYLLKPYSPDELINALDVALWTRVRRGLNGDRDESARKLVSVRNVKPARDTRIEEVVRLIEQSPGAPTSIPEMARRLDLSHSRLRELFKAEIGVPLVQFRSQQRLGEAARLLVQTLKRVSEISYEVGMEPTSFSRLFRRRFGLSPREYRRAVRDKDADIQW